MLLLLLGNFGYSVWVLRVKAGASLGCETSEWRGGTITTERVVVRRGESAGDRWATGSAILLYVPAHARSFRLIIQVIANVLLVSGKTWGYISCAKPVTLRSRGFRGFS